MAAKTAAKNGRKAQAKSATNSRGTKTLRTPAAKVEKIHGKSSGEIRVLGGGIGLQNSRQDKPRNVDEDSQQVRPAALWRPQERAVLVTEAVGGVRAAAALLGVAASQPSRWASGETVPALDQARTLIDVDHVVAHALLLWSTLEGVHDWLNTPNQHLEGVRPITWIREHGTAEVVDALQAETAGAYA